MCVFFFSSRRRHTRFNCDWSSDVCSSDLLPQQTFSSSKELHANGEIVMLQYFQPAHTDTDIYIHFQKANVIHMGDTFFNGFYPGIDASTDARIDEYS